MKSFQLSLKIYLLLLICIFQKILSQDVNLVNPSTNYTNFITVKYPDNTVHYYITTQVKDEATSNYVSTNQQFDLTITDLNGIESNEIKIKFVPPDEIIQTEAFELDGTYTVTGGQVVINNIDPSNYKTGIYTCKLKISLQGLLILMSIMNLNILFLRNSKNLHMKDILLR